MNHLSKKSPCKLFFLTILLCCFFHATLALAENNEVQLIQEKKDCVNTVIKNFLESNEGKSMIQNFQSQGITCFGSDGKFSHEAIAIIQPEFKNKTMEHMIKSCVNMKSQQADRELQAAMYTFGQNLGLLCSKIEKK